jgi:hypothetical protein
MSEESDCSATTRTTFADREFGPPALLSVPLPSGHPHLPQKFDAGGICAPHLAQFVVSAFPHFPQKLLSGGLSVRHFEQRIGLPERAKRSSM